MAADSLSANNAHNPMFSWGFLFLSSLLQADRSLVEAKVRKLSGLPVLPQGRQRPRGLASGIRLPVASCDATNRRATA